MVLFCSDFDELRGLHPDDVDRGPRAAAELATYADWVDQIGMTARLGIWWWLHPYKTMTWISIAVRTDDAGLVNEVGVSIRTMNPGPYLQGPGRAFNPDENLHILRNTNQDARDEDCRGFIKVANIRGGECVTMRDPAGVCAFIKQVISELATPNFSSRSSVFFVGFNILETLHTLHLNAGEDFPRDWMIRHIDAGTLWRSNPEL